MEYQTASSSSKALESIYNEAKDFILIGLTGRTGSGCSTSASILSSAKLDLPDNGYAKITPNELRKYKIIKKYITTQWQPFQWLQVRTVITRYLTTLSFNDFTNFAATTLGEPPQTIREKISQIKSEFDSLHQRVSAYLSMSELSLAEIEAKKEESYNIYFNTLPKFSNDLREALKNISENAYTKIYQTAGDNIRASGHANNKNFDETAVFNFASTINKIVKAAHYKAKKINQPCYIVIDAIRNPYEALFFKERYADFYLFSINTENHNRLEHLRQNHKFSESQIIELDDKEYPKKLIGPQKFISQNIQKCIEISDIHIHNPKVDRYNHSELRCQLAWYITLIMHPGLIMPTSIETCMQIAYSVKQSSGCISRQVGAAVTDSEFSLKSVGWNNTPQGQVPCLLRSADDLIRGEDESAYSNYEKNDKKFRDALDKKYIPVRDSSLLNGRNLAFCFKDLQNEIDGEKNQVHTRSLHAEENAFLQIAKHGGQKLRGGVLFTTASPCELCAKKAYQLGISLIVYIDPYPGIATSHTLSSGTNSPKLQLFRGAVGRAYHQLYQPLMPYKDELEIILSIPKTSDKKTTKIKSLELENIKLKEELDGLKKRISDIEATAITALPAANSSLPS